MSTDLAIFGGEPIRKKPFPLWLRITDDIKQSLIDTFEDEEQTVWLRQNHLLGSNDDIRDIVDAFEKVSNELKKNPKKFNEIKL